MKTSNISFPHPVLGVSNDAIGEYSTSLSVALGKEAVSLRVSHLLKNPEYQELINGKRARFCVEVHCPKTFFRRAYLSDGVEHEISIESTALRDRVEVEFFMTALAEMNRFSLNGWHPDYKGIPFDIRKGALVAYGGKSSFMAETEWVAAKSVSSFLQIRKGKNEDGPFEIMLGSDPVTLFLSKNDYEKFAHLNKASGAAPIFHAGIVFPALIHALSAMLGPDREQFENCKWFLALKTRHENDDELRKIDWTLENVPQIAQTILKGPVGRSLDALDSLLARPSED